MNQHARPASSRRAQHRLAGILAVLAVTATSLVALTVGTAPPAAAEFVSEISLPVGSLPQDITAGPDGNVWFTTFNGNTVGRLTPQGVVTEFSAGIAAASVPYGITTGPDGNLWFTEALGNRIGRITPAGVVTEFSAGITADSRPFGITAGADGNLWFTENRGNRIGRITPTGVVTEFSAGITPAADLTGIAAGPDGNVWFTEAAGNRIGRITPSGVVTGFSSGLSANAQPMDITAGADGSMWFTEHNLRRIGQITMNGLIFESPLPSSNPNARPMGITAGPDGNVWFTESTTNYVGRVDPSGSITEFNGGGAGSGVQDIATGADGRVYFTQALADKIGIVDQLDGSPFVPVSPTRLLDSRTPNGGWNAPLVAGAPRTLDVTGVGGIPEWATSVVMNVTVTESNLPSFLTVFPDGTAPPNASNLNFGAGQTIANHVTVRTGTDGRIAFSTAIGNTHVIADVVGYYETGGSPGNRFTSLTPDRILDSRTSTGGWPGKLGQGTAGIGRELMVRNVGGVSNTATAVVLNVTATSGTNGSFLTVWPGGQGRPNSSSVNFAAGQTIANLVTVPVGPGGLVNFYNAVGLTDVIVDVVGYYDPNAGGYFHALRGPTRFLDDRTGLGATGPWGPATTRIVNGVANTTGPTGVPAFARGLVMNLTATNATQGSFVSAYPFGAALSSSNINFGPGQTIPNQVLVSLPAGTAGNFNLYNHLGNVDLVADATGFFADD